MRESSETKKKKPEKIAKLKIMRVDSSESALAAAGLKLGRQYSWANASVTKSGENITCVVVGEFKIINS